MKPSLSKLVLTVLFMIASSILWRMYVVSRISDTFPLGFPFQFYLSWGPCPPGQSCSESNFLFLLLDVVIWYAFSALAISRFKKFFQTS